MKNENTNENLQNEDVALNDVMKQIDADAQHILNMLKLDKYDLDSIIECDKLLSFMNLKSQNIKNKMNEYEKKEFIRVMVACVIKCMNSIGKIDIVILPNKRIGISIIDSKPNIDIEGMVTKHFEFGEKAPFSNHLIDDIIAFEKEKNKEYYKTLKPRMCEEADAVIMMEHAEFCCSLMAALVFSRPKYDLDGLKIIDDYIEFMFPTNGHEDWQKKKSVMAAFLGECIIKKYGGYWFTWDNHKFVKINDLIIDTFRWIELHFTNGNSHSILKQFENVPTMIKEADAHTKDFLLKN